MDEIQYLGFIFYANGHHPDLGNVVAIQRMPTTKDVPCLRLFLGLISYYSIFLSKFHGVRSFLNKLIQKVQT